MSNIGNCDGVNITVEFNGQIISNKLTADGWTNLLGMPVGESVTVTSNLDGYHPNIQTIPVDIYNLIQVGMYPDVIFLCI
jgi:hypothetical protein